MSRAGNAMDTTPTTGVRCPSAALAIYICQCRARFVATKLGLRRRSALKGYGSLPETGVADSGGLDCKSFQPCLPLSSSSTRLLDCAVRPHSVPELKADGFGAD
jgi:hypothetical protein